MNTIMNSATTKHHVKPALHVLKWIIGWSILYLGAFILLNQLFVKLI